MQSSVAAGLAHAAECGSGMLACDAHAERCWAAVCLTGEAVFGNVSGGFCTGQESETNGLQDRCGYFSPVKTPAACIQLTFVMLRVVLPPVTRSVLEKSTACLALKHVLQVALCRQHFANSAAILGYDDKVHAGVTRSWPSSALVSPLATHGNGLFSVTACCTGSTDLGHHRHVRNS